MRTLLERYYTRYYMLGDKLPATTANETEDHFINEHTNGMVVIGIAPTHPVLKKTITKIEFQERSINNEVSGNKKRGGIKYQKETIICTIQCSDETQYSIRSCIKGKLLEINKNLSIPDEEHNNINFSLLKDHHETSGYFAIIEPTEVLKENKELISSEEYHKVRNIPITKGPVFLKDKSTED